MLEHVLGQRTTALLLTLDESDHLHGHVTEHALERADRPEVHDDAALVVSGTAPVEPAVAQGGLEGWGLPRIKIAGGLYVVMRIEQHARGTLTNAADDGGLTAIDSEQLRLHARLLEEAARLIGCLAHRLAGEAGEGARGDAHEMLEVSLELWHQFADGRAQGVDSAVAHASRLAASEPAMRTTA